MRSSQDAPYTDADFFRILGRISVFFATWDILTTALALRLIDASKVAKKRALNDRLTLTQKLERLSNLKEPEVFDVQVLNDMKKILPGAISVARLRNRYTHDQWKFDPGTVPHGTVFRCEVTGLHQWSFDMTEERTTIADMYSFLAQLGSLQKCFSELLARLPADNQTRNQTFAKQEAEHGEGRQGTGR